MMYVSSMHEEIVINYIYELNRKQLTKNSIKPSKAQLFSH